MTDTTQQVSEQTAEERQPETTVIEQPAPQFVEPEVLDPTDAIRQARALIPVGHVTQPINFAQQVDFAKTMAQARSAIPKHLQNYPGDCLAVIDIAQAAGLHPYMVANQTYVGPDGRLAFMSQLHHALLIMSGRIKEPALNFRFEGDGEDMRCIVWATLKGEEKPREYKSQPISKVRPPMNEAKGVRKGSPLWDKKPEVQFFYDTSRDWGRLHCPIATLGLLAAYESVETPINENRESTLQDRLKNGDKTEGHQNGHAADELAKAAADNVKLKPASSGEPEGHTKIKPAANKPPKAGKMEGVETPKRATTLEKDKAPTRRQTTAAADRAQASADARKREADEKKAAAAAKKPEQKTDDPPPPVPIKPKNDAEYNVYCRDWINREPDPEKALQRWDDEYSMRDNIVVRVPTRNALREYLEKKHGV